MRVRLTKRGTITVPKGLRAAIPEGAILDVVLRDDGVLEFRPETDSDGLQAWFWSSRWQQMERVADEDFSLGRYETFNGVEDFLKGLDADSGTDESEPAGRRA